MSRRPAGVAPSRCSVISVNRCTFIECMISNQGPAPSPDLEHFLQSCLWMGATVRKPEPSRTRETILVVEDTDEVRRMICQILLYDGYDVLEAANGVEALELTVGHCKNIHLVLTDIVMPQMNGHELAEHIRRTKPSTRLLFMSGYTDCSGDQSPRTTAGIPGQTLYPCGTHKQDPRSAGRTEAGSRRSDTLKYGVGFHV